MTPVTQERETNVRAIGKSDGALRKAILATRREHGDTKAKFLASTYFEQSLSASDVSRLLAAETAASKRLLEHMRSAGTETDAELIADTIEGETSLHDAISAVLDRIDLKEAAAAGLKAKIAEFSDRLASIAKAIEMDRSAIEQAMLATEQDSMVLPTATLFVSRRKPGIVVLNEADIPSEFFEAPTIPPPKLNKKDLAAALAAGRTIPGATLDNGTASLTVRRK